MHKKIGSMTTVMALPVLLLLGMGCWHFLRPSPCPLNSACFAAIELGMSKAQVEQIIGLPPGDYTTREIILLHVESDWEGDPEAAGNLLQWTSDTGKIEVTLDEGGRVLFKCFTPTFQRGFLDVLRPLIGTR